MTVLQVTSNLPPVWGPYGEVDGARFFTAPHVGAALDPYPVRTAITLHTVNGRNLTQTTAESFHRNHLARPGDRPVVGSDPPRHWGVSYHVSVGADGSIVVGLDERAGTYSAGSTSGARFIHIVMMLGDWTVITPQHQRVLDSLAPFVASLCTGFGIPPVWCNVDAATDWHQRLSNALLVINDTRTPIGIIGHRDISAAFQTLRNHPDRRIRARAERFRNSHGDPGIAFPRTLFASMVRDVIEGADMSRLCNIREIPPDWPTHPCVTHPGFYIDHGGMLEPIDMIDALVRSKQKSIKGDPTDPESVSAIERNTLKSYRMMPGMVPHLPILPSELHP